MDEMHILLFYKYVTIEDTEKYKQELLDILNKIGLKGRILLANEGINGSVSGDNEQTEKFKEELRKDFRFSDMEFKEDIGTDHPFKKTQVKIKNEIIKFQQNVNLKNTGKHLTAEEFLDIYKKEGDKIGKEIIILDARNNYESNVGKFKGAITPNIEKFTEFAKVVDELDEHKGKKIIMYCTGGIRCEKASAYLKERGFKDVSQLHGGILTFGKKFPDSVWEGTCFVFDKRMVSDLNTENKTVMNCNICTRPCYYYNNCENHPCNEFCSLCPECKESYAGCCSKECFDNVQIVKKEKIILKN
ncbi:MAG: rhodanese-related sulfurtransferase [Nanoarchaeota archaeon]